MALRAVRAGLTVTEVPITFVERVHGTSKMNRGIVVEAMWRVTRVGAGRPDRPRGRPPLMGVSYRGRDSRNPGAIGYLV